MKDLISVIVPVYKAEPYLDKCISSIVNQTYKNLEIILVDDGSPDNCPSMCDFWSERDNRIRVVHQSNEGAGGAKNKGLDVAQGDYIGFVDSDDYIEAHMFEHLLSLMGSNHDIGIAECNILQVEDDDAQLDNGQEYKSDVYETMAAMELHIQDKIFKQTPPNKLYRRTVISGIRFPLVRRLMMSFGHIE